MENTLATKGRKNFPKVSVKLQSKREMRKRMTHDTPVKSTKTNGQYDSKFGVKKKMKKKKKKKFEHIHIILFPMS